MNPHIFINMWTIQTLQWIFDLWIDDEESDLTLSCAVIVDEGDNVLSFTIEDLHTLLISIFNDRVYIFNLLKQSQ